MHFHDFWGTCENQSTFIEDSEDKPNYTPVSRSICFLVFCAQPSCFRKPGPHTGQDRLAGSRRRYEPALSCSSGSWAFASVGGSALAQERRRSQRLLPDLDLIATPCDFGQKKKGQKSGNWECMR